MINRTNATYLSSQANRLFNSPKFQTSRALRRFLSDLVTREGYVFQSFSFDEGFSATQLAALVAHAKDVDANQQQFLAGLDVTRNGTQFDDMFGSVSNGYLLPFDPATAGLKQLQSVVKLVGVLAEFLEPLADDPAKAAGFEDYAYRGLPSSIANDAQLWLVGGHDKRGCSGVLEWCFNEDDARDILESMQRFPDRFTDLKAEPFANMSGMHPAIEQMFAAGAAH